MMVFPEDATSLDSSTTTKHNKKPTKLYDSPISAIVNNVRCKNGAADGDTGQYDFRSSDPWETIEISSSSDAQTTQGKHASAEYCTCRVRSRRMSSNWRSPPRSNERATIIEGGGEQQSSNSTNMCSRCGKKHHSTVDDSGFAWRAISANSFHAAVHVKSYDKNMIAQPQHAEALLQSTPQLRFLSPASTDMQGAGKAPSGNFLKSAIQAAVESTSATLHTSGTTTAKMSDHSGTTIGSLSEYRASLVRD